MFASQVLWPLFLMRICMYGIKLYFLKKSQPYEQGQLDVLQSPLQLTPWQTGRFNPCPGRKTSGREKHSQTLPWYYSCMASCSRVLTQSHTSLILQHCRFCQRPPSALCYCCHLSLWPTVASALMLPPIIAASKCGPELNHRTGWDLLPIGGCPGLVWWLGNFLCNGLWFCSCRRQPQRLH